ncbi:KCNAW-like protein [Mya arenaria]|uniref:KCNAW-like protein n=1 Tax=Mya arenaria TaxID=6604 RepID=A0ABY7E328_MYAAR|nr:KCNAW-like protein [Mya arenaria]
MAYLSVPTRPGLFQNEKSEKIFEQKRAKRAEEYFNRNTRKSFADDAEHVILNIGGRIFKTRKTTLRNVPGTKLSTLDENSEYYNGELNEYFFDRNPFVFEYILDYFRTGSMHIPRTICALQIRDELKFWELGAGCISECCRKFYFDELDDFTTYELIKDEFYSLPTLTEFRRMAWIFAVFYYGLIILTIVSLFISTLPGLRVPLKKHVLIRDGVEATPTFNFTEGLEGTTIKLLLTTDPPEYLVLMDIFCLVFFTLEFIFRLFVCPSLRERIKSWYTLLDVMYLVPAWTRLIIDVSLPFYWQTGYRQATLLVFLDALLVMRVFRIFRLSRHYRGFRVLLLAFKASFGELLLLLVFIVLALIIFSSLIYCAEQYEEGMNIGSIFTGLWWALITLTTVGYGDTVPKGTVGCIVGGFCAVTGLLIIGMVVPIIAGNFHLYYGFRHAGAEDFDMYKPEFVPSESENPVPDLEPETFTKRRGSMAPMSSDHGTFQNLSFQANTNLVRQPILTWRQLVDKIQANTRRNPNVATEAPTQSQLPDVEKVS